MAVLHKESTTLPHIHSPRILHIASGDLWAGAEAQLYTLVKTLHSELRIPVQVVVLNHGVLEAKLKDAGISVITLDESTLNGFQIIYRLYCIIEALQPNIIHTHRTKENILGSIAAIFTGGIPTLRTAHGDYEYHPPWWKPHKRGIQLLDKFIGRYLQRRIIAVSLDMANILQTHFPAKKVRVIENGLDYIEIQDSIADKSHQGKKKNSPFRVGIAGRLVPVDLFLDAAHLIEKYHPELNIEYLIFGDGPLQNELQRLNKRNAMEHRLCFCGHRKNFPADLNNLDALVMTSDHEGLPMVLLEAMALQVPIVAHATGGIPALLDHGNCGLLVQEHTASSYAEAVYKLANDPSLRNTLTQNALQRLKGLYSATENARKYQKEYLSINE